MPDAMRELAGGAAEEARGKKGSWLEKKEGKKGTKKGFLIYFVLREARDRQRCVRK